MNVQEALTKESTEAKARIAKLKEKTKLEQLHKEAIKCEHELTELRRPSIVDWIKKLFIKGG